MSPPLNAAGQMLATPQKDFVSLQQDTQELIAAAEAHYTAITTKAHPATLAEHIELTPKARPYLRQDALTHVAGELVLWRFRDNPTSFPTYFSPWTVALVVKFCNRLTSVWEAFSICGPNYVKGRGFEAPSIECSFLRRDAVESNMKKRKRLTSKTANDDIASNIQAAPVSGQRQESQRVMVFMQTSSYFPQFTFKDMMKRNVKQNDIMFDENSGKRLARLAAEHNAKQKAFVKEENERILVAAARWKLYLSALAESKREEKIAMYSAGLEPDKVQELLHIHDFREEIMYEFVDEFKKSAAHWKQQMLSSEGESDED